jgi:TetR/AcrR family hemagglutinin/protease transcriptional regulator
MFIGRPNVLESKAPKRTRLDPEERRAQLIDCALASFARHGVARATHSRVARCAGVTSATVHFYFKTREDLVGATLRRVATFLDERVAECLLGKKPAYDELVDLAHAFAAGAKASPNLVKVWLDWTTSVDSDIWPSYLEVQVRLHKAVAAAIRRAQREGSIPESVHPLTAARLFVGGGHTIALMQFEGISPRVLDRFISQMAAGALGVGPPA